MEFPSEIIKNMSRDELEFIVYHMANNCSNEDAKEMCVWLNEEKRIPKQYLKNPSYIVNPK